MSIIGVTDFQLDPIAEDASVPAELFHFNDIDPDKIFWDLANKKLRGTDVRAAVIDGSIEDPIDATPNIKLTIHDPDWELLDSGALSTAIDMKVGHRWYRLAGVDVDNETLVCTFILRHAAYLMHHNKHQKANRKKTTRAEFIMLLVRSVKKVKIPFFCKQLHKEQKIEKVRINRDGQRQPGLPAQRDAKITVKGAPADSHQRKNIEQVLDVGEELKAPRRADVGTIMCIIQESAARRGATAGQFVGLFQQGRQYGWPATRDPYKDAPAFYEKFIPLVRAHPNADLGTLIAQVQRPLHPEEYALGCNRWRDEAERAVDQYIGGGGTSGTEYRKRYEFETLENEDGTRENYLAAIYRLADEVQWRAFWVGQTLHYASEEDLFKARSRRRIERDDVEGVSFHVNGHRKVHSMTLSVRMVRWVAPVGSVVTFGPPTGTKMIAGAKVKDNPANGRWLITSINKPIFNELGEITLSKPIPEKLEPAPQIGTRQIDDGSSFSDSLGGQLGGSGAIDDSDGARGIVESCALIAGCPEGGYTSDWHQIGTHVVSDFRAGDIDSDHGWNNRDRAARDIAFKNVNALTGPPSHTLDIACRNICDAFGFDYRPGTLLIKTFNWHGFRCQILWRTPLYGGHMGHIHVGARRIITVRPQTGTPA